MSQDDLVVDNADGATVRADINSQIQALGTLMSGATAPSTTYAYMLWADTANTLLKQRNSANNAWVSLGTLVGPLALLASANVFTATQVWKKGADKTAASALDLSAADGNMFDVAGATTITSITTLGVGTLILLQFDSTPTVTYHATNLILAGAQNFVAAAGDILMLWEYASGDYMEVGRSQAGAMNLQDRILQRAVLKDYAESVNAIGSIGGGTQDIDLELGNYITGTVDTSTTTFTFSNFPASGKAGSFTLELTNGGSQTVNWPASVDWPGGSPPTLTETGIDLLVFSTRDGGTIWYGFAAGLDMGT